MKRIVLTGGPCGGKTTALPILKEYFSGKGLKVVCLSETAEELLKEGKKPFGDTAFSFHRELIERQLEKEEKNLGNLQICDRGCFDIRAYISEDMFHEIIRSFGYKTETLMRRYDGIFHLTTAAIGAEYAYTTENDDVRYESSEQAAELDGRSLVAWEGHSRHIVLDNSTDFEGKITRLENEISRII